MWMWGILWFDFATEYTELLEGTEGKSNTTKLRCSVKIEISRGDSVSRPLL